MIFEIENIRSIKSASLKLDLNSPLVLIGSNNSGKSSLLEMIYKSIIQLPHNNSSSYSNQGFLSSFYRRENGQYVRPSFKIAIELSELILDEKVWANDATLVISSVASQLEARINPKSMIQIKWIPYSMEYIIGDTTHKIVTPGADFLKFAELENSNFLSFRTGYLQEEGWIPIGASTTTYSTSSSNAAGFYSENPLTRAIGSVTKNVYFLSGSRDPLFSEHNEDRPVNNANVREVTPVLKRVFSTDARKREQIESSLCLIFEEIKSLHLDEVTVNLAPFAELQDGTRIPIADMGFGLRNVLQIITILVASPDKSIILIDEPEIGLNQAKQREFAKIIELLSENKKVVLTTQSEAFCKGLGKSRLAVIENINGTSFVTPIDIKNSAPDRKLLAKIMGINPLYLVEGGKIIFVEGQSDKKILENWIQLNFPATDASSYEVQSLGGCGKVNEEFAKPMFKNYRDKIFFILDSDKTETSDIGPNIARLKKWFEENEITNFYILNKREIENYLGYEALANSAKINASSIKPLLNSDSFDYKKAINIEKVFDEMKMTVNAYLNKSDPEKKLLFGEENETIKKLIGSFLTSEL